jgi:hypothetical protein
MLKRFLESRQTEKNVWDALLDKTQAMRDKITGMLGIEDGNGSPIGASVKGLRELAGRKLTAEHGIDATRGQHAAHPSSTGVLLNKFIARGKR